MVVRRLTGRVALHGRARRACARRPAAGRPPAAGIAHRRAVLEAVDRLSGAGGFFRSENLVSNEHTYQYVIPALKKAVLPGGIYLGVAPDQNFTYMAAIRPRMAFILDIRRGNLLEHLMYKALFELSVDRADFVSRLFSKPRPAGLDATTTSCWRCLPPTPASRRARRCTAEPRRPSRTI